MLSKSDFLIYLDSPLHFWALKHNQYEDHMTEYEKHLSDQGYEVEQYAKEYIKQYVDKDFEYQKEFNTEELTCRSDIVVFNKDTKKYDIYEVKSSTEVKQEYEYDTFFQYYIASKTIDIGKIYLLHLNKNYIRGKILDLGELFEKREMNEAIEKIYEEGEKLINEALKVEKKKTPSGLEACYKPKDCPCKHLCFPSLPKYSIYDISNIIQPKLQELRAKGITRIVDVPEDFSLSHKQRLQIQATKENRVLIQMERIKEELKKVTEPIYFLDYETYSWAIPKYENHKVHQNVVFQYSLHVLKDGTLNHYEEISLTEEDPSKEIIQGLKETVGSVGSILVWNKTFEKDCNAQMARIYPEERDFLIGMNQRMYDLGDVFSKKLYVSPEFKGSWSIKKVLPVLVPELNYDKMEISNGTEAIYNWSDIVYGTISQKEKDIKKENLLRYCELDTFAMVKIYEFLRNLISE